MSSPWEQANMSKSSYYRCLKKIRTATATTSNITGESIPERESITEAVEKCVNVIPTEPTQNTTANCQTPEHVPNIDQYETDPQEISTDNSLLDVNEEFCTALAYIANKHKITNECTQDLLKLFRLVQHETTENSNVNIPESYFVYQNRLNIHKAISVSYGWICPGCQHCSSFSFWSSRRNRDICENCSHVHTLGDSAFIIFDVYKVLQLLLRSTSELLPNPVRSSVEDYPPYLKRICSIIGKLNPDDLTITLNTDGAPLFKSSNCSFWPILFSFNDIPAKHQRDFIGMCGLWISTKSKPSFENYLTPVVKVFEELEVRPFVWTDYLNRTRRSRVFVSAVLCDSIARPMVQRMFQFNAIYGCPYCKYRKNDKKCHYFPHNFPLILRNHNEHLQECQRLIAGCQSRTSSAENYGIKGMPFFATLKSFNCIQGYPVDIMHCCFLGVTKQFVEAMINPCNANQGYYLKSDKIVEINGFLQNIRPPSRVSRKPRPLNCVKFFKAHEWQMFCLYFSPIVFQAVLTDKYFEHWLDFIRGVSLISTENVTRENLDIARLCFFNFSSRVQELYGIQYCTFNVHLLLHLCDLVHYYGSLKNITMFPFENYNMTITSKVTSTQGIFSQIISRYVRELLCSLQRRRLLDTGNKFLSDIIGVPSSEQVLKGIGPCNYTLKLGDLEALNDANLTVEACKFYQRMNQNGVIFQCESYTRIRQKRNNCYKLSDHLFFVADVFIQDQRNLNAFALGTRHYTQPHVFVNDIQLSYIQRSLSSFRQIEVLNNLKDIVMLLETDGDKYFLTFLNTYDNNHN